MGNIQCRKCYDSYDSNLDVCPNCGEPNHDKVQKGQKVFAATSYSSNSSYSEDHSSFVGFCTVIAYVILILGIIGSIVLAVTFGKTESLYGYRTSYDRNWLLTIMYLAVGFISTSFSFILVNGIGIIVDYLDTIARNTK